MILQSLCSVSPAVCTHHPVVPASCHVPHSSVRAPLSLSQVSQHQPLPHHEHLWSCPWFPWVLVCLDLLEG